MCLTPLHQLIVPQDVTNQSLLPAVRLQLRKSIRQIRVRIFLADPHDPGSGSLTNNMVVDRVVFLRQGRSGHEFGGCSYEAANVQQEAGSGW